MVTHKIKKLPKNTFEAVVDLPWDTIQKEYTQSFQELLQTLEVEGFRKGKVPASVGEKHIKKEAVYQRVLQNLLPRVYRDIVAKEGLKPVVDPRFELVKAKEKEDWQFKIILAEKPKIVLPDYKTLVKEAKSKSKKADIWVPGKEKDEKKSEENRLKMQDEILSILLKKTSAEISELIFEEELNRRLSRLVDDVQKIGLTMEAYLKSKGLTLDDLKSQYAKEIEDIYKMEFLLGEIADKEQIQVEETELNTLFDKITNEKERLAAQENMYFYASLLRKQKTLDFILNL